MTETVESSPVETFLMRLSGGVRLSELRSDPVLVGVSGGADSVSLLYGLLMLKEEGRWDGTPIVLHVDHAQRTESADDAEWVRNLCERCDVEVIVRRVEDAPEESMSEDAARSHRYRLFREEARTRGVRQIAVAHTRDDQAETVLHHIVRGTGLAGLRGIPLTRELDDDLTLHRPLLSVTRADVVAFLRAICRPSLEDATNADKRFTRNRIRHELLPCLERDFNPQVRDALLRLSRLADESQAFIEAEAERVLSRVLRHRSPHRCALMTEPLSEVPEVVLREMFVRLWVQLGWPRRAMSLTDWKRLADACRQPNRTTLPGGIDVRHRRGVLVLTRPDG